MTGEPGGRAGTGSRGAGLRGATVVLLALVAGVAIANNYAVQPALAQVAADLDVPVADAGLVSTGALVGCVVGFALLLPLVDRVRARRLVVVQLVVLAAALLAASRADRLAVLAALFVLVGACAGVAAQASSVVGRYGEPARRGAQVAVVASGLSAGVLLSRLVGGALADLLGWRWMLVVFAGLVLVLAAVAASPGMLPDARPAVTVGYGRALAAQPRLLRDATLRRTVLAGCCWYLAFAMVWLALALALARPPHGLSPAAIGLYGLAGVLGFVVLPFAGRLTDRRGAVVTILLSLAACAAGLLVLAVGLGSPVVTVVGLALFDAGCFAAQAANQARVIAVDPGRAGALSSVYLVVYFAAGAVGTVLAPRVLDAGGWVAVMGVALAAVVVAALVVGPWRTPTSAR